MLGALAQYLLLAGLDTEYDAEVSDNELRRMSRNGRVVLTRDRALFDSLSPESRYYVEHEDPESQFPRAVDRLDLPIQRDRLFTRCTDCNRELVSATKSDIEEQVPPKTQQWIDDYQQCPDCGSVYWKGSHYRDIVDRFRDWNLLE
jgi:uncharacterized protein with PIN domain